LAFPCPVPPFDCTTSAINPAKEGEAADVPAMTDKEPFSSITYPSWPAAVMAISGTVRMPFPALAPATPFCQEGCA
jgi:hypothetical protein